MRDADDAFTIRYEEPETNNRTCLIVGIIVGSVLGVVLLCGGCCIGGYWWGELQLDDGEMLDLMSGEDVFTPQVRSKIEGHPVILERIGAIQEFTTDWDRSLDEEGEDVYVFRIRGDKEAGTLRAVCITVSDEEEDVPSAELILDSGERFQLFPDQPLN